MLLRSEFAVRKSTLGIPLGNRPWKLPLEIIGRGLLAQSLQSLVDRHPQVVAFATGVGDSGCQEPSVYDREVQRLTATLTDCERSGKRLIYFSTATQVHGPCHGLRNELTPLAPITPYGRHKCFCESLIRDHACAHLIVRLGNLVGPRQNDSQLIPQLVRQVAKGSVRVQRHATRDLLDVADLASLLDQVLACIPDRETLVVASGVSQPVSMLVEEIQRLLDCPVVVQWEECGEAQEFSIDRLRSYVKVPTRFHHDYPLATLRRYVTELAENPRVVGSNDEGRILGSPSDGRNR